MSFTKYDSEGKSLRRSVGIDCQKAIEEGEVIRVEQSHKDEVNINNIVRKHGVELIAKTAALQEFRYDDVTGNDFQESMNAIIRAKDAFESVPSDIRRYFDNDPAKYMDYIHQPENKDQLVKWGMMNPEDPPPAPIKVIMVDSKTGEPIMETPPVMPAP